MPSNRAGSMPRCRLCRQPATQEFEPLCSSNCRDRDLLKWLGEDYRVPVSYGRDNDSVPEE